MQPSFASRLPLSRFQLDRDALARERDGLFEDLWADPATRILPMYQGSALMSSPTSLALLPVSAAPEGDLRVYLGRSIAASSPEPVGTPIVAVEIEDATQLAEAEWGSLYRVATVLDDRDAGMFVEALALLNWHASHRFSPRTGEPTLVEKGGWVRRDPVSNTEIFPRTDPAVIVGVIDAQDRLLLGSNALWESNRYSLLAGFVEPGESFEAAIRREILEEAGIPVIDPVYLGSQPWPFPASIMVGFTARVDPVFTGVVTPDGTEIMDLRWFSRDELAASLGEIRLPGRASIARAIVEEWFGAEIDDGQQ